MIQQFPKEETQKVDKWKILILWAIFFLYIKEKYTIFFPWDKE